MDASREHSLKHIERRFNVRHTRLAVPMAKVDRVTPLEHGDGAILVPAKRPVRSPRLVE
jgi:hypothetical protein